MIRFMHCVKRREDISVAEFRRYWNSTELQALLDRAMALVGGVHLKKTSVLAVEFNVTLQEEHGGEETFDGVFEVILEHGRDLERLTQSVEFRALREEMTRYQSQFVDFAKSQRFCTEW